jgi:hypothetical protein
VEGIVRRLAGQSLKSLGFGIPAVSFHAGELTNWAEAWPENPTSRRLPVIGCAVSFDPRS